MRPEDWLAAVRLRRLAIVNCIAVCLIAAALVTLFQPRQYRSEGWVYVLATSRQITASDMYRGSILAQQRAATYQVLATSSVVLDPVIQTLGLDTTSAELASKMEVTHLDGTPSIEIAVLDPSASRAKSIVDAVSTQLITTAETLEKTGTVTPIELRVQSPGNIPGSAESPMAARYLAIGAAVGIGLAAGCVVVTAVMLRLRRRRSQAFWVYVSDRGRDALMLARLVSPDHLIGRSDDEPLEIDPLLTLSAPRAMPDVAAEPQGSR